MEREETGEVVRLSNLILDITILLDKVVLCTGIVWDVKQGEEGKKGDTLGHNSECQTNSWRT